MVIPLFKMKRRVELSLEELANKNTEAKTYKEMEKVYLFMAQYCATVYKKRQTRYKKNGGLSVNRKNNKVE